MARQHELVLVSFLAAGTAALERVTHPICACPGAANTASQPLPHTPHAGYAWPRASDVTRPCRVQHQCDFCHGCCYDVGHHANAHVVELVISTLLRQIPAAEAPERVHVWHDTSHQSAVQVPAPVHRLQMRFSMPIRHVHDGLGFARLQVTLPLAQRPVRSLGHGRHGCVFELLPRTSRRTIHLLASCAVVLGAVTVEAPPGMDAHHSLHKHTNTHQNPWWTCKMHVGHAHTLLNSCMYDMHIYTHTHGHTAVAVQVHLRIHATRLACVGKWCHLHILTC